ncbi:hypothetical protein C5C66_01970 [Rathayibacter toxicus]|uniref:Uncharacterized protein n=1 Tax=Rathayibacter toxicus TaxID=145458 RepID=A0A2S5Y8F0_9MICO|nr:hypothetical protein C5D15_01950 [Rathayibacter toxicus]PPG47620.1 hypothetical protein C5D16_01945 [Rathayibacter toxicus]PPH24759.1 hypothetical protein C5D17_01910 [Rathayibacter toxicus]PPH58687.1 hypothetical protein C5D30_01935 [Rathayibacter toxicus]PPH60679.1 hypothetical protein C5C93_01960 [Rathayibacter toxicus]
MQPATADDPIYGSQVTGSTQRFGQPMSNGVRHITNGEEVNFHNVVLLCCAFRLLVLRRAWNARS